MTVTYNVGDVRQVLSTLPDDSVDLVISSPPFLGLRSYLPPGHADKANEIGSEATPGEFIDTLLDVVEACRRFLAPHGSLVFELGDTYAGSGGSGGDYGDGGWREGQAKWQGTARSAREPSAKMPWRSQDGTGRRQRGADEAAGILAPHSRPGPEGRDKMAGWPLDKSLCLIPELLRIAMVYGFNPLTGRETPRWRARNVVRWVRPNPPVGALADKFRPATSELLVACVGRSRYFDLDAVRTEHKTDPERYTGNGYTKGQPEGDGDPVMKGNPAGAPPLDWWKISTHGYPGTHYATWPPELLTIPIKSMCPERVCLTCGKPSERIIEPSESHASILGRDMYGHGRNRETRSTEGRSHRGTQAHATAEYITTGWTDCGHDNFRPGLVLDPFAGTGTTLYVAAGHGRDAIGIDIDERNVALAHGRLGMLMGEIIRHQADEVPA